MDADFVGPVCLVNIWRGSRQKSSSGVLRADDDIIDVETDTAGCELIHSQFFLQGDSGGAAIQEGQAVGIVSFGRGCAQPLSPSVFADIAAPTIREFITKHTDL